MSFYLLPELKRAGEGGGKGQGYEVILIWPLPLCFVYHFVFPFISPATFTSINNEVFSKPELHLQVCSTSLTRIHGKGAAIVKLINSHDFCINFRLLSNHLKRDRVCRNRLLG